MSHFGGTGPERQHAVKPRPRDCRKRRRPLRFEAFAPIVGSIRLADDFKGLRGAIGMVWARLGTWLVSLLGLVVAPLIPLGIEAVKNADFDIKGESILLTAAVLAVGYFLTSESNWGRFIYGFFFCLAVTLDYRDPGLKPSQPGSSVVQGANWIFQHPAYILGAVLVGQASERFVWHVAKGRSFPDRLEKAGSDHAGHG